MLTVFAIENNKPQLVILKQIKLNTKLDGITQIKTAIITCRLHTLKFRTSQYFTQVMEIGIVHHS